MIIMTNDERLRLGETRTSRINRPLYAGLNQDPTQINLNIRLILSALERYTRLLT